jgi:tetratricopeptide (TPR) repeat protein
VKTTRRLVIVVFGALLWSPSLFSQSPEPPEFDVETKKEVVKPSQADTEYFEVLGTIKSDAETKAAMPALDAFIEKYPDYAEARYFRANCNACTLNSQDFGSIVADLNFTIAHSGVIYKATDSYSLLAKIEFAKHSYGQAVELLDKAMTRDLDEANRMFNIGAVEPEKTSKFCTWNLTDLDTLIKRFQNDFRVWLFRGLYYQFFTTFKEDYYPTVMQNFQQAALLRPESPLPSFFIGQTYMKQSFWTKKAWASDENRDELMRNAIRAYSKAIQLDSKFVLGYSHRATGYLSLKQYQSAIKDYDRILSLDPENNTAHSDRGIAKLESGHYLSAISDFGDAIRGKKEGNSFLPELYGYRGDAEVKLDEYNDAIADYSKAIELRFSDTTILLSLTQIRALYPEFDKLSDDALCRRIHDQFWPNMEYAGFANKLMHENGKWSISLLNELYEKRGDAYLQSGDFKRGAADFQRIYKGIPNFANSTDRWRLIGASTDGALYFLDVKTADFPSLGTARMWIKTSTKRGSETSEYQLECKARRLRTASFVRYDPNGKVLNSSDATTDWLAIIPDSVGERLYNGACPQGL